MKRINIGDRIFIGFIYVFLTLLAFSAFLSILELTCYFL